MRVNTVKSTRKDQGTCGRCGIEINIGDPYRWIKPRYGSKRVRCMKQSCSFRGSDLVSNDKLSRVYAAGEGIEDALNDWTPAVHVKEILEKAQAVADAVEAALSEFEEVAQEYEESADNIEEYFSESENAETARDNAENIEGWREEFDGPLSDLQEGIAELEKYISDLEAKRDEQAEYGDVIIGNPEAVTHALMEIDDVDMEPFNTSEIESAIEEIETAASSCPV